MQEQITRMNSIVEYQLQRAATAGATSIGKSINVKSVVDRILKSLNKMKTQYKACKTRTLSKTTEDDQCRNRIS